MDKMFEWASLVHQLCSWNHMSSDSNVPHHEIIIFLWKKEIDFIWPSYPFFFIYLKNLGNILLLQK